MTEEVREETSDIEQVTPRATFQVQGEDQLLAKADSVQEKVSTYKEELANIKETYQSRINLAASFLNPGSK